MRKKRKVGGFSHRSGYELKEPPWYPHDTGSEHRLRIRLRRRLRRRRALERVVIVRGRSCALKKSHNSKNWSSSLFKLCLWWSIELINRQPNLSLCRRTWGPFYLFCFEDQILCLDKISGFLFLFLLACGGWLGIGFFSTRILCLFMRLLPSIRIFGFRVLVCGKVCIS